MDYISDYLICVVEHFVGGIVAFLNGLLAFFGFEISPPAIGG
jgi:hypothetical protein